MLEGDLADLTLAEVLRLLETTGKTGRLTVTTGRERGRVDVRAGRVHAATAAAGTFGFARRLLGAGIVDGDTLTAALDAHVGIPSDQELARAIVALGGPPVVHDVLRDHIVDAAFDLVRRPTGTFRFVATDDPDPVGSASAHDVPIEDLLAEITARLVRWHDLLADTGAADDVVSVTLTAVVGPGRAAITIDADAWALLALVDGHRTVDDLIRASGRGAFGTRASLAALLARHLVVITPAGAPTPVGALLATQESLAVRERSVAAVPTAAVPTLRPDPAIDDDLLRRLIVGVEAL